MIITVHEWYQNSFLNTIKMLGITAPYVPGNVNEQRNYTMYSISEEDFNLLRLSLGDDYELLVCGAESYAWYAL